MALVSVVVPSHNRLALLPSTVASVQAQSHANWQLLIVDDGSSDGTPGWVRRLSQKDCRIQLLERASYRPEAHGAQVCRNLGLQKCAGEAVLFLDSDDLLAPDCLRRRLAVLAADLSIDAVVGQGGYFAERAGDLGLERIWAAWHPDDDDLNRFLANDIPWQTSGPLWRRSALQRVGAWDEQLQHVGHDHEFHVRALCQGISFKKLPGVDYYWRVPRSDSLSAFEAFKAQHRSGGMISAYQAILADVVVSTQATHVRRRLMGREMIMLALQCRNLGGSAAVAERGVRMAVQRGVLQPWVCWTCLLLLRCWWRLAGRLPAMALLNRLASLPVITA